MVLFHGTSAQAAQRIGDALERGSFVTEDETMAEIYALLSGIRDSQGSAADLSRAGLYGVLLEIDADHGAVALDRHAPQEPGRRDFQLVRAVPIRSRRRITLDLPKGMDGVAKRGELEDVLTQYRRGWERDPDRPSPLAYAKHSWEAPRNRTHAPARPGIFGVGRR